VIRCVNIARQYDNETLALKDVSFNIARGEFVAIMGPSGCGKSTLLNILGLLDRPTHGHYFLKDTDVSRMEDKERTLLRRSSIGFVFQAFNLLARLTALENVCLPMSYAGVPREEREERAKELLARVGLSHKTRNIPLHLSGGERQRVGIARALANHPDLLLADEPTGNLDSHSSREILTMLKGLHKDGMTILLVTHDPNIAAGAGRVLHVKDGKLT
jgi:putative ABC transport system ATP-binding protein